jgi:hypothetical protein
MATKTITGNYPSGYTLNPSFDTLNITATATVGGFSAITTTNTHPSTINNLGTVHGTTNGIVLPAGGTVNNKNSIGGKSPIVASGDAATVHNYGTGTIASDRIFSARYSLYGLNDGSYYRRPSISMRVRNGSVINDAGGKISNGISIVGGTGTVVNNGEIGGPVLYQSRYAAFYGIASAPFSIKLHQGTITNGSESNKSATITGGIVNDDAFATGNIAVQNFGTILGSGFEKPVAGLGSGLSAVYRIGDGINIRKGSVVNGSETDRTAKISAYTHGIVIGSDAGLSVVTNFGTIDVHTQFSGLYPETPGYGVKMSRGTLTNGSETDRTALIRAATFGIHLTSSTATNFGTIEATDTYPGFKGTPTGAVLQNSKLTNGSASDTTALISGMIGVDASVYVTIVNFGKIEGTDGTAISFHGNGAPNNRLVLEGSGALDGDVLGDGATLELAADAGAGTLTGLGNTLTGFATVTVDAGAAWSLSGTSKVAAGTQLTNNGTLNLLGFVINGGKITNSAGATLALKGDVSITTDPTVGAGQFTNDGLVQKVAGTGTSIIRAGNASLIHTGTIDVQTGTLMLTSRAATIAGLIKGAGTIQLGPGLTILRTPHPRAITTAGWTIAGAAAHAVVARNLSYAGSFAAAVHTELTINPATALLLSGQASFTDDTVDGAGRLTTAGATTLSEVAFNGTGQWWNTGTLSETGQLTLGHAGTLGSVFVNRVGATFNIAGNSGIVGTAASSAFINQGRLAKTVGTLSTIAAQVINTGIIEAKGGTLDLQRAVSGTGGVLKIGGGKTLQADAAVGPGQTVDFNGLNDKLVLTDATHFAAKLQDFGAGDRLDLRQFHLATTTLAFAENAAHTAGVLTVKDGALTAKINLLGQYMAAGFHKGSDGAGGTFVTYTPQASMALAPPHS